MARQNISVTTDCVIFFRNKQDTKVLLVKRKKDPFKDKWALPGGFLEDEEPLEDGAKRELEEETGSKNQKIKTTAHFWYPGKRSQGQDH